MSKRPDTWMPFYIGDYLADTMHLSRDHHGGYMLLIIAYWRNGEALADDNGKLAAITKASTAEWKKLRPVLAEFFTIENGRWRHKRIDAELEIAATITEQRSSAGKASAAAKAQRKAQRDGNEKSTDVDDPLQRDGQQNAIPSPLPSSLRSEDINANALIPSKRGLTDRELQREFESIWPLYPRRVDKGDALKAYRKARKQASREDIQAGVERYAASRRGEDAQFTKHFATWLNHQCWTDESPGAANGSVMPDRPDGPPPPLSERELKYLETGVLQ